MRLQMVTACFVLSQSIFTVIKMNTLPLARKLLVNFEELNNKQFAQYLTASDETTIDDHISNMTRPFVWGTQIELFAITSFFQIPLYYCEMHEGAYKWKMLGPISDVDSLLYPADKGTSTIKIHHFELMYHTGVHYDCVVNKDCTNRAWFTLSHPL